MSRSAFSRRRAVGVFALGLALALFVFPGRAGRADDPGEEPLSEAAAPVIALQSLASSLGPMTFIANAGDARLFLTIQTGRILIYSGGSVLPAPFLDLSGSGIISSGGERGLLSVAFHPQYAANGFFFVYYTDTNGDIAIARYTRSLSNPNLADPASGVLLLPIPHPTNSNHNGGQLQFGPDGYLYIGTGDGGAGNDPPCNAQNDDQPLGKLLRIDVDQNVNTTPFYGIPPSNPQALGAYPRNLTWAKGVRNPWRFSFDRLTGDLWIGEVGQSAWEEIDFQPHTSTGGENYGWKIMEGNHCGADGSTNCPTSPAPPPCTSPPSPLYKAPVFEYDHGGGRCSVTGGYVYRGSQDPALFGTYLYGDYCSGQIWGSGQLLTPTVHQLTTFGEDAAGELYIGTGSGQFFRIVHVVATPTPTPTPPPPTATPTPTPADSRSPIPLPSRHRPEPRPLAPRQPG
jgi:glucose/arabinose dehydrogenase